MITLENDELRKIVREEVERGFDRERARKQIQNQVEDLIFEVRNERGYVGKLECYTRLLRTAQKYDLEPQTFNLRICAENVEDTIEQALQEIDEAEADHHVESLAYNLTGGEATSVQEARHRAKTALREFRNNSEGDSDY